MSRRRREYETGEYADMLERMIRAYGRRVASEDWTELERMVKMRQALDEALGDAVRGQVAAGFSWADVGRGLGITRQSAWELYSGRTSRGKQPERTSVG